MTLDRIGKNARANRHNPTEPEARLWRHLSASRLGGLKFRRQHPVESWIVDFFCASVALGVEIDGHTHDAEDDARRDAYFRERLGIEMLRFTNTDVMTNMDGVLHAILTRAKSLPPRWIPSGGLHPNPSSEEEGL
ncbi:MULTISPECIES: endonuclease domain-containing protein [unclassified Sphingomonas]|jgi:very-short-patch-repair endonuclease|uniref:endonuclease domain-containing protein n=1 Tax=unclassified Sphingomonas TaxID=196159 RepID=UPI000E106791|nr:MULTISPECIES: endonuclease domain-containing protein [unclassified Sphingomonas]AXJ95562.1 hypothetical protein DM480_08580 [Sphingomonas sp. FARSPH]